jgi:hypothetical protein
LLAIAIVLLHGVFEKITFNLLSTQFILLGQGFVELHGCTFTFLLIFRLGHVTLPEDSMPDLNSSFLFLSP